MNGKFHIKINGNAKLLVQILTRIDYLSGYLRTLEQENKFCSYFPTEDIYVLLRGYDPHYRELLFNIYELVLHNAAGSLMESPGFSERTAVKSCSSL